MLEYTNLSYLAILIISEPSNAWLTLPSRNKITLRGGKTFFFFIGASANSAQCVYACGVQRPGMH